MYFVVRKETGAIMGIHSSKAQALRAYAMLRCKHLYYVEHSGQDWKGW